MLLINKIWLLVWKDWLILVLGVLSVELNQFFLKRLFFKVFGLKSYSCLIVFLMN